MNPVPFRRGSRLLGSCIASVLLGSVPVQAATYDFPIYSNAPSGRQLSGQHAPASTPALTPPEAQKKFVVPKGFEVRLFASEPMVVNPVAMTWDERGRLWVVELYEYPLGAKAGQKGRDRIKILEDRDGDGVADHVTVFAEGFSLATGILLGNGGVYLGQAPHLLFLEDTNGDDKADRQSVVLTGFGMEDRHELLNGFTWGPDGQMYMTHGVFTYTAARRPDAPAQDAVVLTAGVARMDPRTRRFEVFAEGTSNPWGVDFDRHGNAFVSACVIDHLFHLSPGGIYARQAGQPPFPFAYDTLPSIVDHRHHMAAYAGVNVVQGSQWPAEWQGAVLQGNIHQNALNVDRLTVKGSSFSASKWTESGDFLTTSDGWFMPVSTQTGPDGAVWVMDWYDRYPCYQNANADPEGVDREHGRIWRVVWTGDKPGKPVPSRPDPGMNLGKLSSSRLAGLLADPNVWQRRMAQRILGERGETAFGKGSRASGTPVHRIFRKGSTLDSRLSALWTLHTMRLLDESVLDEAAADREPAIRTWSARLSGERGPSGKAAASRLEKLAADPEATVRLAVAVAARQWVSGSLTVDTPPRTAGADAVTVPVLSRLLAASAGKSDPTLDFLYWMAWEPLVARNPAGAVARFVSGGATSMPLTGVVLGKIMRRACDLRDEAALGRSVVELGRLGEKDAPLAAAALRGLLEGLRGKSAVPSREAVEVIQRFSTFADSKVRSLAQQIGVLWGDSAALKANIARIQDPAAPDAERIAGIRALRSQKNEDTRDAMMTVVGSSASDAVRVEAVRALGELGGDSLGDRLLGRWDTLTPATRRATAELLATRNVWISQFLKACKSGAVKRGDIPPTVIRSLSTHNIELVRKMAEETFGKFNASSDEKLKLIAAKRKVVTQGPIDLAAGQEVARKACFLCHAMYGEGGMVGPDLTGVGRSSLDALLHNVINPNEIIGQGYENVEVETRDGQTVSGRLVENTDTRVRLLQPNGQEEVVSKGQVAALRVTRNSVMPEGLESMPDADFRNMIWFILAHPKDGKPLTEERKRELMGGGDQASIPTGAGADGESIALWNPEWMVSSPAFESAPAKLPEFEGRRNVLMTHPVDGKTPASIARAVNLPRDVASELTFAVASHPRGNWQLRVVVDGEVVKDMKVDRSGPAWSQVSVDLSRFAGRRVVVRLENAANDWNHEFGYWHDLRLTSGKPAGKQVAAGPQQPVTTIPKR